MPTIAIVGYTNAGKSTLLNAMTGSTVIAENKLFSTLDPTTRRMRFPDAREVVLSDTVGFIEDLPPDLLEAFRATFEEIGMADLILHVMDATSPDARNQRQVVEKLLADLNMDKVPRILVANKVDQLSDEDREQWQQNKNVVLVSALTHKGLARLLSTIDRTLWGQQPEGPSLPLTQAPAHEDAPIDERFAKPWSRKAGA